MEIHIENFKLSTYPLSCLAAEGGKLRLTSLQKLFENIEHTSLI